MPATTPPSGRSLLTDAGRAQALPFLEAVDPAVDTFGNRDFDFGPARAGGLQRVAAGTVSERATGD